ncbi:ISNCY family transposase [bacterium]|nr:ISNCY family transposase [bacterium]
MKIMTQKLITMAQSELTKCEVISKLLGGSINGTDASKQLNLSIRHIRRLKAKVKVSGAAGLIHGNRGQESNRKIKSEIIKKAVEHLKTKYLGFDPTHASEKLDENNNIQLGKETVRQIMIKEKLWTVKPRKQPKQYRSWRARKDNYGKMQQFDGSYHLWLEDRAEELCLLLSVDDATGKITHAKFDYNEGVIAVFKFWTEYINKHGLPTSIYLDKFSTYKINHPSAVDNKELMTQFQRATKQVGINLITAHSAQAKGRVERMNKTLQNRLVKEMRLANISTVEDANKFLQEYIPKFNDKFSVVPARRANLHKTVDKTLKEKLPQIFSRQEQRQIQNDYTIRFKTKYFQLNQEQPTTAYKKDTVIIEEHLNGEIKINLKEHYLNYTVLPERPKKIINIKLHAIRRKQSDWKPPINHPWRTQFLFKRQQQMACPVSNNIGVEQANSLAE